MTYILVFLTTNAKDRTEEVKTKIGIRSFIIEEPLLKCHNMVSRMVSKKKREELILQLLGKHGELSLNQIYEELPENTKKQIYNALKSLFEKDQIITKVQRINDRPTSIYQLTKSSNKP